MSHSEEVRDLETIPVGALRLMPTRGCAQIGAKVDEYLVKWRTERQMYHQ